MQLLLRKATKGIFKEKCLRCEGQQDFNPIILALFLEFHKLIMENRVLSISKNIDDCKRRMEVPSASPIMVIGWHTISDCAMPYMVHNKREKKNKEKSQFVSIKASPCQLYHANIQLLRYITSSTHCHLNPCY